MDLQSIQAFIVVAEELSFRRSAARLYMSQPALSRQMRLLEAELGTRLFEREQGKAVRLTDAGLVFLEDARLLVESLIKAQRRVNEAAKGQKERLAIGNYSALAWRFLPLCLKIFRQEHPQVEVSILEVNGDDGLASILNGRIDIGFAADFGLRVDERLQTQSLMTALIVVLMAEDHFLARQPSTAISLEDLSEDVLLYRKPHQAPCYSQRLPEICARARFHPRELREIDRIENVLSMTKAGYGVAVLPDLFSGLPGPGLSSRRLNLDMPPYELHSIWRREAQSKALQKFRECTSTLLTEHRDVVGPLL